MNSLYTEQAIVLLNDWITASQAAITLITVLLAAWTVYLKLCQREQMRKIQGWIKSEKAASLVERAARLYSLATRSSVDKASNTSAVSPSSSSTSITASIPLHNHHYNDLAVETKIFLSDLMGCDLSNPSKIADRAEYYYSRGQFSISSELFLWALEAELSLEESSDSDILHYSQQTLYCLILKKSKSLALLRAREIEEKFPDHPKSLPWPFRYKQLRSWLGWHVATGCFLMHYYIDRSLHGFMSPDNDSWTSYPPIMK